MPLELLEEIRLLANIESDTEKLLPVLLVGQPELAKRLNEPALRQLKQRVALRCTLGPLSLAESAAYIAGRIDIAGGDPCRAFFARGCAGDPQEVGRHPAHDQCDLSKTRCSPATPRRRDRSTRRSSRSSVETSTCHRSGGGILGRRRCPGSRAPPRQRRRRWTNNRRWSDNGRAHPPVESWAALVLNGDYWT